MNLYDRTNDSRRFRRSALRLLSAGVAILALAAFRAPQANGDEVTFLRGDVNGDGVVSVSDSRRLMNWMFVGQAAPDCLLTGDVDGDGMVDISDAILILFAQPLGTQQLCAPYPDPGAVDVPDPADCESYGGGERVESAESRLEVLGATADADGLVVLTVALTSQVPVSAFQGTLSVEGDILAQRPMVTAETLVDDKEFFNGASVVDGRVGFAYQTYVASESIDGSGAGDEQLIAALEVCLKPGTAAGTYALTLESAELTSGDGVALLPQRAAGEIVVPADLAAGAGCEDESIEVDEPACEPDGDIDDPPPGDDEPPPDPGLSLDFLRGDANTDGRVSISDSLLIRRYLFNGELPPVCLDAADAQDDGVLDISDQVTILSATLLGGPPLPEPNLTIGPDPTADGLGCAEYEVVETEISQDDIIRIGDVEAAPGDEVDVPVFVTNTDEVEAFQLVIRYDPARFEPQTGGTVALGYEGTFYERFADPGEGPGFGVVATWPDDLLIVGMIPDFIHEGSETPPGEDRLVFKIRGRIPDDAPEGTVDLTPTNGENNEGTGPYGLRNELTVQGTARWVSIVPVTIPGQMKIAPDITIFVRGDVNSDLQVDLSDAIFILDWMFLGTVDMTCPDAADANDDGYIDISDPITILRAEFVGDLSIATPFPVSGRDPTPDDLGSCKKVVTGR